MRKKVKKQHLMWLSETQTTQGTLPKCPSLHSSMTIQVIGSDQNASMTHAHACSPSMMAPSRASHSSDYSYVITTLPLKSLGSKQRYNTNIGSTTCGLGYCKIIM
ncbi:uncharacterized protein G2W53_001533 [Senna tora]|uniref:Uncharacterized protein n=1 Tax=Senna tora TaxID=362788 RepID=A0A834XFZ2_9FABA|nr:uncharacterized protein G2W53_001533 [Senna tora]